MRILAFADKRPERPVLDLVTEHAPDLICTLGDLGLQELAGLERCPLPKAGVYGNHCSPYFETLGITNVHLRRYRFGDFTVGGFEGSIRYKAYGDYQYSQQQAWTLLRRFPAVDLMLCHSPPYGINDEVDDPVHQGFKALHQYVTVRRPKLLLHGHTAPDELVTSLGDTRIEYVCGWKLIEIEQA